MGDAPNIRWIVYAGFPLQASERRRDALPVGAQSPTLLDCCSRISSMLRTIVDLPVPGPPVMMEIGDCWKLEIALCWSGSNDSFSVILTHQEEQ